MVAAPQSWIDVRNMADLEDVCAHYRARRGERMRVATKYVNLTRRFFNEHGVTDYRIVESLGATEGAPAAGSAELIVDITTTGATLAANGLKTLEDGTILKSEANLVASLRADWGTSDAQTRRRRSCRASPRPRRRRRSREVRAFLPARAGEVGRGGGRAFRRRSRARRCVGPRRRDRPALPARTRGGSGGLAAVEGRQRVTVQAVEQVFEISTRSIEALQIKDRAGRLGAGRERRLQATGNAVGPEAGAPKDYAFGKANATKRESSWVLTSITTAFLPSFLAASISSFT